MQRISLLAFVAGAAPVVALALAAGLSPSTARASATDAIPWGACPAELSTQAGPLARRLQCSAVMAPRDWEDASSVRDRPVGLIRITAGSRAKRQGTLFMNFGGPGLHPAEPLVHFANEWQATDAADPVAGGKRRLVQQYDLLVVIPPGVDGSNAFDCPMIDNVAPNEFFLGQRTDANWNALVAAAHGNARDCSSVANAALINSGQHVRDMELVRSLIGEAKLNYYGASYGGWVGALYGSLFPQRVGRMVLDSSVDASGGMERFHLLRPRWREHDLARFGTMPAAAQPAFWGLGSDSGAIRTRLQAMPKVLRALWGSHVIEPAGIVAALQVADMYAAEPVGQRTRAVLKQRIAGHHFHDRINQTVSKLASELVDLIPERKSPGQLFLYGWSGTTLATYCNDGRWRATPAGVRAALGTNSPFASFDDGDSSLLMLICARWPQSTSPVPSMVALRSAPAFLMIHNDLDRITPLKGAHLMASELPDASLVVVEDASAHGVMAAAPSCAMTAATAFLLNGTLPATKRSACIDGALVPVTPVPGRDEL